MKQKVQPIAQPTWELTHTVKRGFRPCPRTMGIMTVSIREYESAAKSWSAKYTQYSGLYWGVPQMYGFFGSLEIDWGPIPRIGTANSRKIPKKIVWKVFPR